MLKIQHKNFISAIFSVFQEKRHFRAEL